MAEADAPTTPTSTESEVASWLVGRITFYGQVDADAVSLDAPLTELGLDSIYVMTLCGDLEDTYGISIDPSFFADYSTLGELAHGLTPLINAS